MFTHASKWAPLKKQCVRNLYKRENIDAYILHIGCENIYELQRTIGNTWNAFSVFLVQRLASRTSTLKDMGQRDTPCKS